MPKAQNAHIERFIDYVDRIIGAISRAMPGHEFDSVSGLVQLIRNEATALGFNVPLDIRSRKVLDREYFGVWYQDPYGSVAGVHEYLCAKSGGGVIYNSLPDSQKAEILEALKQWQHEARAKAPLSPQSANTAAEMKSQDDGEAMSVKDAAEYLGLDKAHVRRLLTQKKLQGQKIGHGNGDEEWAVSRSSVEAYKPQRNTRVSPSMKAPAKGKNVTSGLPKAKQLWICLACDDEIESEVYPSQQKCKCGRTSWTRKSRPKSPES